MRNVIKTIKIYNFDELSNEAKNRAKNNHLNNDLINDIFYADVCDELKSIANNSDLAVCYSLTFSQGDGFNICGDFYLLDFLDLWQANKKEKKTIEFYIKNSIQNYKFEKNNYYSYSCKFIDKKNINFFIEKFIDELTKIAISKINKNLIIKFFNDFIDFFADLDAKIEKRGYDFLYNIDDKDFLELCKANNWEFLENGELFIGG